MNTMQAAGPAPGECLQPTYFLDYDTPEVAAFAAAACGGIASPRARAIALYDAVRDGIRYDGYRVQLNRQGFRASQALADGYGFCISKAALLTASARAAGIPARLGYGDVRNHLTTEKLRARMQTDLFTFHGYSELWIEQRWVKATPAFNLGLCEKFGVKPLDFDGVTEYIRDHGAFADIPFDRILASWAITSPAITDEDQSLLDGDFAEDAARERAAQGQTVT